MRFLFDERYRQPFHLFGWLHITVLVLAVAATLGTYRLRGWLKRTAAGPAFRYTVAALLIVFETTFQIWIARENGFNWVDFVPLGLCAMMEWITVTALLFDLTGVVKVVMPWAFLGCSLSFIVVNMDPDYTFPHFRFFHYFGIHFLFLIGNVYYLFTGRIEYRYRDLLRSSYWLAGVSLVVLVFDQVVNQNFMFLRRWPDALDFVNNALAFPLNTTVLIVGAFLIFNIFYWMFVKHFAIGSTAHRPTEIHTPVAVTAAASE